MDLGSIFEDARQMQLVQKIRLRASISLLFISLWLLDINFGVWRYVFYGVLCFSWLLKPIKRIDLLIWKGPPDE